MKTHFLCFQYLLPESNRSIYYFYAFEIPHLQQWSGLERLWGRGHGLGLHATDGGEDVLVTAAGVAAGHAASHPVFPSNAKLESVIYMGIFNINNEDACDQPRPVDVLGGAEVGRGNSLLHDGVVSQHRDPAGRGGGVVH